MYDLNIERKKIIAVLGVFSCNRNLNNKNYAVPQSENSKLSWNK